MCVLKEPQEKGVCVCVCLTTTEGPHRADLVTIPPIGMAQALDFHITAPALASDPTGPQLHRPSLAKAARYHTTPNGILPWDVAVHPSDLCRHLAILACLWPETPSSRPA